jgi:hypothetical protein
MKEQRQKIKREHDIRSLEIKEHPLIEEDIYENWMHSNKSSQNLQQ